MEHEDILAVYRFSTENDLPFWHSLYPLSQRPGLEFRLHADAWRKLTEEQPGIDPKYFHIVPLTPPWIAVELPYPPKDLLSFQKILPKITDGLNFVSRAHSDPNRPQLGGLGYIRTEPYEDKGCLLEAFASGTLASLLAAHTQTQVPASYALSVMRHTARYLKVARHLIQDLSARTDPEGCLFLGLESMSGGNLGVMGQKRAGRRDLGLKGYQLTSDNIYDPASQLVILSGFAAVLEWADNVREP